MDTEEGKNVMSKENCDEVVMVHFRLICKYETEDVFKVIDFISDWMYAIVKSIEELYEEITKANNIEKFYNGDMEYVLTWLFEQYKDKEFAKGCVLGLMFNEDFEKIMEFWRQECSTQEDDSLREKSECVLDGIHSLKTYSRYFDFYNRELNYMQRGINGCKRYT